MANMAVSRIKREFKEVMRSEEVSVARAEYIQMYIYTYIYVYTNTHM